MNMLVEFMLSGVIWPLKMHLLEVDVPDQWLKFRSPRDGHI